MNFRYKKYSPGILRPVIPVEVIYKNTEVYYEVLVDSGADLNIFDAGIAEILGINFKAGKPTSVAGLTGISQAYFLHEVNLKVGGHLFKNIEVGFMENMPNYSYGIVGQKGFFDIFVIKFDLLKEELELKQRK